MKTQPKLYNTYPLKRFTPPEEFVDLCGYLKEDRTIAEHNSALEDLRNIKHNLLEYTSNLKNVHLPPYRYNVEMSLAASYILQVNKAIQNITILKGKILTKQSNQFANILDKLNDNVRHAEREVNESPYVTDRIGYRED